MYILISLLLNWLFTSLQGWIHNFWWWGDYIGSILICGTQQSRGPIFYMLNFGGGQMGHLLRPPPPLRESPDVKKRDGEKVK